MPQVSIEAFGLQIHDRQHIQTQPLSEFNGRDDFIEIVRMYLDQNRVAEKDRNIQKAYQVEMLDKSNRHIRGIIKSGGYGQRNDIVDIDAQQVSYTKDTNEAELVPFYYQIFVPERHHLGIMLLQKTGVFGITSAARKIIERRFNDSFRSYKLTISPLLPESVVNELVERGRLSELKLLRFSLPPDIVDAFEQGTIAEDYTVEVSIKAKGKKSLQIKDKIVQVLEGRRRVSEIIRIDQIENEGAKVVAEVDGQKRTINLTDFSRMRPSYNIDSDIHYGEDGHPTFDSIDASAVDLMGSLSRATGITGEHV